MDPSTTSQPQVSATGAAIDAIEELSARHGPLAFFQSGGCCDGSAPICMVDGELPPGPGDLLLGTIGGAKFYVDAEQFERWKRPRFLLDVATGPAEGFSLSPPDAHFLTRAPNGAIG